MPSFVVMPDPRGGLKGGPPAWGSGYLPATHQGTTVRPGCQSDPAPEPRSQACRRPKRQRRTLDLIGRLNERHLPSNETFDGDLLARINTYELAYRMQSAAPDIVDVSQETCSDATSVRNGREQRRSEFGTRCLLARRMIERGVRFRPTLLG